MLKGKRQSSFCEQKEAKKLCHLGSAPPGEMVRIEPIDKSFCFFFQKEDFLGVRGGIRTHGLRIRTTSACAAGPSCEGAFVVWTVPSS